MTEPKELRSIDELFRNTFNNLPDTPADSGWDQPSDRVWQHVSNNIQAPVGGWSVKSIMLLSGFAVTLVVGLYFAFSSPEIVEEKQALPLVTAPVEIPAAKPEIPETAVVAVPEIAPVRKSKQVQPRNNVMPEQQQAQTQEKSNDRVVPRAGGAVPLPGSNSDINPNTTEELKAERERRLKLLWKTPVKQIPVPREKKTND